MKIDAGLYDIAMDACQRLVASYDSARGVYALGELAVARQRAQSAIDAAWMIAQRDLLAALPRKEGE